MIVLSIIMTILPVVPALFPADVLAMNPMMPLAVARDPDHFIVAVPIACAMIVEWPVANLDLNAICSNSGRKKNTRRNNGDEQKFVFNHYVTDHGRAALANTFFGNT
jgi:hypothetical protein